MLRHTKRVEKKVDPKNHQMDLMASSTGEYSQHEAPSPQPSTSGTSGHSPTSFENVHLSDCCEQPEVSKYVQFL